MAMTNLGREILRTAIMMIEAVPPVMQALDSKSLRSWSTVPSFRAGKYPWSAQKATPLPSWHSTHRPGLTATRPSAVASDFGPVPAAVPAAGATAATAGTRAEMVDEAATPTLVHHGVGHSRSRRRRHIRAVATKNQPESLKEPARMADSRV